MGPGPTTQSPAHPGGSQPIRIALVSYHFPPDPEVGAQRPSRLVDELRARGVEVDVITARLSGEPATGERTDSRARVHTVKVGRNPRHLLVGVKQAIQRAIGASGSTATAQGTPSAPPPERLSRVKRNLLAWLWLPDDLQGFILPAARQVAALHRERPFDAIYSSGPPFSVHLAGLLAAKWTRAPWWAEFRDPWTGTTKEYPRSAVTLWVEKSLERRCIARAHGLVAVTPSIASMLKAKLPPAQRGKVLFAYNGISTLSPMTDMSSEPDRRLTMLHAGTLYLGRDPRPLLAGLATLRRASRIDAASIRLLFLGEGRWFRGESVQAMAAELGLEDIIEFRDSVPPEEAKRMQLGADVLVLLAQRQPAQVPQKLFDYLGTRKPILAFTDQGGETANLLQMVGGHSVVPEQAGSEAIADAIEEIMAQARWGGAHGKPEVLEMLLSRCQLGGLADEIVAHVGSNVASWTREA